mmetsp:Transcript_6118/g.10730  ORF Transcript_6118/g.10730 Transcript_6118/m.10730 type:complete len:409 (+) Transcript_6118:1-1227(+)
MQMRVYGHKKLFYVFTSAGKYVWSLHGDVGELSTFMGTLAAILFKFHHYFPGVTDTLRYMQSADMVIVALCTEALWYVCISKTNESVRSLRNQLNLLHSKIISTLTENITTLLVSRPNYDAHHLLGGTDNALSALMRNAKWSPGFMEGYQPVRLPAALRNQVMGSFKSHANEDLVFGFLLTQNHVLHHYAERDATVRPFDVVMLVNLLSSNSSLRSSMTWTPICLPGYSDQGFLYAYISFFKNSPIGLALLSTNANAFNPLKAAGDLIQSDLTEILQPLEEALKACPYPASATGIKELRHFVFQPKNSAQYTMSGFDPALKIGELRKDAFDRLLRRYYSIHAHLLQEGERSRYTRLDTYRNEIVLCTTSPEGTLLAAFKSLTPTIQVMQAVNTLLRWLRAEEASLFIK